MFPVSRLAQQCSVLPVIFLAIYPEINAATSWESVSRIRKSELMSCILLSITALLSLIRLSSLVSTCLHSISYFIIDFSFNIFSDIYISLKDTKKFPPPPSFFDTGHISFPKDRSEALMQGRSHSCPRIEDLLQEQRDIEQYELMLKQSECTAEIVRNLVYVRSATL